MSRIGSATSETKIQRSGIIYKALLAPLVRFERHIFSRIHRLHLTTKGEMFTSASNVAASGVRPARSRSRSECCVHSTKFCQPHCQPHLALLSTCRGSVQPHLRRETKTQRSGTVYKALLTPLVRFERHVSSHSHRLHPDDQGEQCLRLLVMWLVLVYAPNSLDGAQAFVFTRPGFGSNQPRCQPHFALRCTDLLNFMEYMVLDRLFLYCCSRLHKGCVCCAPCSVLKCFAGLNFSFCQPLRLYRVSGC